MEIVARKYTHREIIKAVTAIRRRNNVLWMRLFKVAMTAPGMKKVIREIVANDKKVSKWMSRV